MTQDRIKEIQSKTAYPDSVSVQQALLQVWHECRQDQFRTADNGTRHLAFNGISDLIRKVENIKKAHQIKSKTFRKTLEEKGIRYIPIDDYGVAIDISGLSEEDLKVIRNQDDSYIQNVYEANGVF